MLRSSLPLILAAMTSTLLVSCRDTESGNAVENAATNIVEFVPEPEASRALDRASLLKKVAEAASAFAIGADDRAIQRDLSGRQFAFRLVIACGPGGPNTPEQPASGLRVRADGKSYEVRARPTIDAESLGIATEAGPDEEPATIQNVQGFWVERPWILAAQCPKPAVAPSPEQPDEIGKKSEAGADSEGAPVPDGPDPTVGIAQYFTADDSRVGLRSGRDYARVVSLAEGEKAPSAVFLVLEGRLRAWPGGKVIRCRDSEGGGRPVCVVGAAIDRVVFERADDRSIIAEWTN